MRIYLVRHAEKESEGENPNLTKKGIKQAKLLARKLKKIKFTKFYCSNLNRAIETAEIVSKEIKLKLIHENCLREFESTYRIFKRDKNRWKKEELMQYKKLISFIDKLTKDKTKESNILIIAHGLVNRVIMAHLLKMPLKKFIIFKQEETCANIFYWVERYGNWRLEKMNDNSHVPERLK